MLLRLMVALESPETTPTSLSKATGMINEFSKLNEVRAPEGFENHRATLLATFTHRDKYNLGELAKWSQMRQGDTSISAGWQDAGTVCVNIVNADTTQAAVHILHGLLEATPTSAHI